MIRTRVKLFLSNLYLTTCLIKGHTPTCMLFQCTTYAPISPHMAVIIVGNLANPAGINRDYQSIMYPIIFASNLTTLAVNPKP